ncbi:MAG: YybH family protein [Anaerolineae bacterium]
MTDLVNEIRQIEQDMACAFNDKDVEKFLSFFSADLVGFSSTTHDRIQGLDALKKTFEYYLQEGEKVEFSVSNVAVQTFGDVAVASFHWVVTIDDGNRIHDIPGRGTHVFYKKNHKWLVVHEHFSRAHHYV